MSLITVFKVSFLLMRTKVELCVSCTVLARSHSRYGKILPREDPFWCSLLGKNHSWWSALLQHACCSKIHPQHNTWHGRFVSLITLIHITKLDYCMQYKSFVILGHAYFLNPYIQVARRLLAYKRWSTPTERALQGGLDGDDGGASQYTESAFQTSVTFLRFSSAAKEWDSLCLSRKFGSVAKQKEEKTTLQEVKLRASPRYRSIHLDPRFGV